MKIGDDIGWAAKIISQGGLVAFPTETVYGLGADAFNAKSVARVFQEKERPSFDPLIVHISNLLYLQKLTTSNHPWVTALAEKFWPGPLTIVLPKSDIVPNIVTSGLSTVGIRMPNNKIALELIERSGRPIAAPSANKFGKISPTTAKHVQKQLKSIDYILDGGRCTVGIESTVISLNQDGFVILREGIITQEDLVQVVPISSLNISNAPIASPGLLNSHYSPDKPIYIAPSSDLQKIKQFSQTIAPLSKGAFISFSGVNPTSFKRVEFLSKESNLREAAVNLFSTLHSLEEDRAVEFIVVEPVPGKGIAKAIMDKLNRASYRYR